ncbi:MAG: hypothetical protein ABIB98_02830 [bacterium]
MSLPNRISRFSFHPIFISIVVIVLGLLAILVHSSVKNKNLPSFLTFPSQNRSYKYDLAEFIQKQQTFSPYTKYEPSFEVDKTRKKLYFVYKVMDDTNVWQAWTGVSDLDGNNWEEFQQTASTESIERISLIYNPKNDLIYYFYRTTSKSLMMAIKSPNEKKWGSVRPLSGASRIDDLSSIALDDSRNRIIFAYTKNMQIATAVLDLANLEFKERIHTNSSLNSYIPNMRYDPDSDTAYIVFPRGNTPGMKEDKQLWLARVKGDGTDYRETKLTNTNYENTWPFLVLDVPHNKIYVKYGTISEPATYSELGLVNIKERINLGVSDLDGKNWRLLRDKEGMEIFGVNPQSGLVYGLYQTPYKEIRNAEGNERFFVIYDPNTGSLKKQAIPSGNKNTYYDAAEFDFDPLTNLIFGAQQVCASAGERAIECQIWTYTGKILDGKKSKLSPQEEAQMALEQSKELPDLKIISAEAAPNKIKILTNRKLSFNQNMVQIRSNGQNIVAPNPIQINQDLGFEWRFAKDLSSYEASYKVCALSDPSQPICIEGTVKFP